MELWLVTREYNGYETNIGFLEDKAGLKKAAIDDYLLTESCLESEMVIEQDNEFGLSIHHDGDPQPSIYTVEPIEHLAGNTDRLDCGSDTEHSFTMNDSLYRQVLLAVATTQLERFAEKLGRSLSFGVDFHIKHHTNFQFEAVGIVEDVEGCDIKASLSYSRSAPRHKRLIR